VVDGQWAMADICVFDIFKMYSSLYIVAGAFIVGGLASRALHGPAI